jgi:hypothetical protein
MKKSLAASSIGVLVLGLLSLGIGTAGSETIPADRRAEMAQSPNCDPLTITVGTVITVSNTAELGNAVSASNASGGNTTILLQDGTYVLNSQLWLDGADVVIRSASGNRDSVVVKGQGMSGSVPHVFEVNAADVTIADMSFGEVANHAIQIHGENDRDNLLVHNVRIYDTGEQMIKGSVSFSDNLASDNGVVECSLFEYTAGIGPQYYIGGVDVHRGANWIVRDNEFRHIRSPESWLAEHAVHFWSDASGTLVERNKIVDCDRGIGFGLGSSGHVGGIIRNNMVYVTRDVGIGLESSPSTKVYNNTVYTENYLNSIEYRWSTTTGAEIINNLTNQSIASRDGGSGTVQDNVTHAQSGWFVNATAGDLHLASNTIASVIDQGQTLADVSDDFDGDSRPQASAYDIGADEYQGYGFALTADPSARAIAPGGATTYTLSVQPSGGFTASVSLIAASPSPSLTLGLAPTTVIPSGQAALAVTDTHTGMLLPGSWYTVPITGTGGGVTRTVSVSLLIGGAHVYLPVVLNE